jgi:hypothetical protein
VRRLRVGVSARTSGFIGDTRSLPPAHIASSGRQFGTPEWIHYPRDGWEKTKNSATWGGGEPTP